MSTIKILLAVIIATLFSNVVYAYDFEVDGIYYNILSEENKTCGVTRNANDYKGCLLYTSDAADERTTKNTL